jgi:hypothetical protein
VPIARLNIDADDYRDDPPKDTSGAPATRARCATATASCDEVARRQQCRRPPAVRFISTPGGEPGDAGVYA